MRVCFTIFGVPQGKERPRFVRCGAGIRTYTPEKTLNYEQEVQLAYRQQCGAFFSKGTPLRLDILAFYPIPKSTSKNRQALMAEGKTRPTVKPDYDNVAKIIADALNGVAYHDDAQIVTGTVDKRYGYEPVVHCVLTDEVSLDVTP